MYLSKRTRCYCLFFSSQTGTAVTKADAACSQTEEQRAFSKGKVLAEIKLKWVEERTKLHAALTLKFPHDAARVESYFRRFAKPRHKKKAE